MPPKKPLTAEETKIVGFVSTYLHLGILNHGNIMAKHIVSHLKTVHKINIDKSTLNKLLYRLKDEYFVVNSEFQWSLKSSHPSRGAGDGQHAKKHATSFQGFDENVQVKILDKLNVQDCRDVIRMCGTSSSLMNGVCKDPNVLLRWWNSSPQFNQDPDNPRTGDITF